MKVEEVGSCYLRKP